MPHSVLMTALLAMCIASIGCNDKPATAPPSRSNSTASYEKTTEAMHAKTRQIAEILGGVKDQATAEAAATQLRSMRKDMVRIVGEFKELPSPTSRQARLVHDTLGAASAEIQRQRERIEKDPELAAAKDALDQLDQAMKEVLKGEE